MGACVCVCVCLCVRERVCSVYLSECELMCLYLHVCENCECIACMHICTCHVCKALLPGVRVHSKRHYYSRPGPFALAIECIGKPNKEYQATNT